MISRPPTNTPSPWPSAKTCTSCAPIDPLLVRGVASYGLELFRAVARSRHGLCADRARQRHLRRHRGARGAGPHSRDRRRRRRERPDLCAVLRRRRHRSPPTRADTMAGGLAVRVPDPEALDIIRRGAARIVTVSEAEIRAGDARSSSPTRTTSPRAPAPRRSPPRLQERDRLAGKRVAVIQSGGNIDRPLFAEILAEEDAD